MTGEGMGRGHRRENRGILADRERRVLVWIARRLPPAVGSDHLTALGFLGMLGAGASLWAARLHPMAPLLAVPCLAVNWFGDSLDGTLARVRGQLRPRYGYYVDHILDLFGAVALLGGFAASGLMSPQVAGVFLLVYLVFNAEIFLATHALGEFRMSYWGLGPTELRILLAVGILRAVHRPWVTILGEPFRLLDTGFAAGAAVLALTCVLSVVRNTRRLYAAEPLEGALTRAGTSP